CELFTLLAAGSRCHMFGGTPRRVGVRSELKSSSTRGSYGHYPSDGRNEGHHYIFGGGRGTAKIQGVSAGGFRSPVRVAGHHFRWWFSGLRGVECKVCLRDPLRGLV